MARINSIKNDVVRYLFVLISTLYAQFALADDCVFDQKARVEQNIKLQKKYPGSQLVEGNFVLVVPVEDGKVRINIGGCSDGGVSIELETRSKKKRLTEKAFMGKILWLAKTYSQGMIDLQRLETTIKEMDWIHPLEEERLYFLNHLGMPFEVYEKHDGEYTIIGLNAYN